MSKIMDIGSAELGLLTKMLSVLYPHKTFGTELYKRAAEAVIAACETSPADKITLHMGLKALSEVSFENMDNENATNYLKSIEGNSFFSSVTGTGLVALYNDHDVWKLLGYEGASYHLGGYVDRGFNDLDWLPEPRITEYEGASE